MNILFIASISIITPNPIESRRFFIDTLGLPLGHDEGDEYYYSAQIAGSKHFGIWPLTQAAQSCFGTNQWPEDKPVPQMSIEFEVENAEYIADAAKELEEKGYSLLHGAHTEPWGQTIARLQTPEGVIVGISYAPQLH
jgi:catechol 2,3-dioxygenase-like lactoylglutathione lyase family enzyme